MKYKILQFPEPCLRKVCQEVVFPLSEQTITNIRLLKQTFRQSFVNYQTKTLGLSAPQIGAIQRFLIIPNQINYHHYDLRILSSVVRKFQVYINPKITRRSEKQSIIEQNCLSVGHDVYRVQRAETIQIQYYDQSGLKINRTLYSLRARVFLHEYDHLGGILMMDKGIKLTDEQKQQVLGGKQDTIIEEKIEKL